jgi:ABC-type amino acid transport substrate-binding protein
MLMRSIYILLFLAFLCSGEKITLVTDNWEPYYGSSLKNGGYLVEVVKEALKIEGVELEVQFKPWKRVLAETTNGKSDGILGLYFTKERMDFLEYSDPIEKIQVAFYCLMNRNINYENIYDLKKYKIGVVRGYSTTEEFDSANFLNKDESTNSIQNLKKLLYKRIDLIIDSKRVIEYSINSFTDIRNDSIKIIDPPLEINELYVGFSKKNRNHLKYKKLFNNGLKRIKQSGVYDKIVQKHGFK